MTAYAKSQLILLCLAIVVGCSDVDQSTVPRAPTATSLCPVKIVVMGDPTRIELLQQLTALSEAKTEINGSNINAILTFEKNAKSISTSQQDRVKGFVSACSTADLVVIAVDARKGPMPVHRQHILFARQMHIPSILIAFTHSNAIDDPDLLQLEEIEMRALLNKYDWKGDAATAWYDSVRAKVKRTSGVLKGSDPLMHFISKAPGRPKEPPTAKSNACTVNLYALHRLEGSPLKSDGIKTGEYSVVIGSVYSKTTIRVAKPVALGATGNVTLTFESPIRMYSGQRCTILYSDRIAAAGVVTKVKRPR